MDDSLAEADALLARAPLHKHVLLVVLYHPAHRLNSNSNM